MDAHSLFSDLANADGLPKNILEKCVRDKEETIPFILELLERAANGEKLGDDERSALFFLIHIIGELGVEAACSPILKFLQNEQDYLDATIGDAITVNMHKIIISVYDGNAAGLYEVIDNHHADVYARSAVFDAWTYLVAVGKIERLEAERYLVNCFHSLQPQSESYVWTSWLRAIAILGYSNLRPLAERAIKDNLPESRSMDMKDFNRIINEASSNKDQMSFLHKQHLFPFSDTIGSLSTWHGFSEEYDLKQRKQQAQIRMGDIGNVQTSHHKVGRNDPCPCGSGIKFKKCCLN
jgi:hypothetical protein